MMIKCLHRSSPELLILLRLNHRDIRQDPWNPAPHILCAVERDERVFLCLQRLIEFNQPPLKIVSNYIDFFKQVLEGLTFLHEHSIAQLSYLDLSTYMVDLGSTTFNSLHSVESFDRTKFPVRYYFTNFSSASEFNSRSHPAFQKDVEDCGAMMDRLAAHVSPISRKLNTLLFEALCKSLPAEVFDIPVATEHAADGTTITITPPVPAFPPGPFSVSHRSTSNNPGSLHIQTINVARKPKSNTLSPRAESRSRSPITRARSSGEIGQSRDV
ncbi:hypothetical protein B0H10DRAFT_2065871 [Mycena sp. CBHHK59/15]|nr:hypothetical protein B0H10DRAFT_2065871 [Mycena sp. CBHHK59/15]